MVVNRTPLNTYNWSSPVKALKCDLCDHVAEAETFEDWMMALRPHYMEAHADVMSDSSRGKEEMEQWMKDNRARFDAA